MITKRPSINFFQCNIPVGAELISIDNPDIKVTVVSERKVQYNEELTSLSAIAKGIKGYNVAGPMYFTYKQLNDMKERRATFVRYAQNPRMVVKFYKAFARNVYCCHKQLLRKEEEKRIVYKYVRERNIGQIVAFLSFVEVFMPDELQQIIKYGRII